MVFTNKTSRLDALPTKSCQVIFWMVNHGLGLVGLVFRVTHQWHCHTILLWPTVRLIPWNCDKILFIKSSLNRFATLRTASMICSHLNVIILFLSGCGTLQFILFPRSEQIGIARSLTMHYRNISDECSVLMFKKMFILLNLLGHSIISCM